MKVNAKNQTAPPTAANPTRSTELDPKALLDMFSSSGDVPELPPAVLQSLLVLTLGKLETTTNELAKVKAELARVTDTPGDAARRTAAELLTQALNPSGTYKSYYAALRDALTFTKEALPANDSMRNYIDSELNRAGGFLPRALPREAALMLERVAISTLEYLNGTAPATGG